MDSNIMISLGLFFIISLILCYSSIWILLKSPLPHFFVDQPDPRKVHQSVTPRAGGVCIILCFLGILLFWNRLGDGFLSFLLFDNKLLISMVLFALCIFFIGFIDDTFFVEIKNIYKLICEIIITTIIILLFGNPLETIFITHGLSFNIGWVGIPVSIIWVVGVANAVNIVDGIDGLAGSVSLLSFIFIGVLAGIAGYTSVVILCALLAGLVAGFLFHNISPALIFLGDTGSLFLGIILGFLSLYVATIPGQDFSFLVAPMFIGFPILDTFIAMSRRFLRAWIIDKKGLKSIGSVFVADGEHIHHRFMYAGLDHTNTCIVIVLFSFVISVCGLSISYVSDATKVIICIYLSLLVLRFIIKLHFIDRIILYLSEKCYKIKKRAKVPICIINADEILRQSLEEYTQDYYILNFIDHENFPLYNNNYATVIINSKGQIKEEIEFAKSIIKNRKSSHIVIIADKTSIKGLTSMCENRNIVFKSTPLYIPHLFSEIYPFARSNFHNNAFSNTF